MKAAQRKDGDLFLDGNGNPVIFARDFKGKAGAFVKRYNASGPRWEMVPATTAHQATAGAAARPRATTTTPSPIDAIYARRSAGARA